jgi:hypothetical protein
MNKDLFWAGHVLSGSPQHFQRFVQTLPIGGNAPAQPAAPPAAAVAAAGAGPPNPDGLRNGWIYVCALKVTAANFKVDATDPSGSLAALIDWTNAAAQQAAVICIYINQEAPAIAAHDAPQYQLVWSNVTAGNLSGCPTVGDILALIKNHYS